MLPNSVFETNTASDVRSLPEESTAPSERGFLQELGERVRAARARGGMTRKDLARDSGVSERYLAHLEGGQGNISVLLLQKVATALDLPLSHLLTERHDESVELTLLQQFLRRLSPQQLSSARAQLMRDFGTSPLQRRKRIALIGLRGAGKSTLGAALAKRLRVPFIELDQEVEREAGTSLSEIFLLYGQAGYRRYERRCLENLLARYERCVIATGGSIVSEPGIFDLLLSTCFTVWLKALPEEHMARVVAQGDTRPMAGNSEAMDDLRRILEGRGALYGQADLVVDTSGTGVEQSLGNLERAVRDNGGTAS